jgi:hypothetical protein
MNTPARPQATLFTPAQWQALDTLRQRYAQDHDPFSDRERARLRFLRWLYQTGRLVPSPHGHPGETHQSVARKDPRSMSTITCTRPQDQDPCPQSRPPNHKIRSVR